MVALVTPALAAPASQIRPPTPRRQWRPRRRPSWPLADTECRSALSVRVESICVENISLKVLRAFGSPLIVCIARGGENSLLKNRWLAKECNVS